LNRNDIAYEQAMRLVLENAPLMPGETIPLQQTVGLTLAASAIAQVDSPSADVTLRDGYAVHYRDVSDAGTDRPVRLVLTGSIAAGRQSSLKLSGQSAIRILTGAPMPASADTVIPDEWVQKVGKAIVIKKPLSKGDNVLPQAADVRRGDTLAEAGERLTPQLIALLTAAGISQVTVYRRPRIGLLANGSEVRPPGSRLAPGELYASNAALQQAWFQAHHMDTTVQLAADCTMAICRAAETLLSQCDVLITSGGVWKGDRDLIVSAFDTMGWTPLFHRVRVVPGKSMGMGLCKEKPIICLPGGPAANAAAFFMFAAPAVWKMGGSRQTPFLHLSGRIASSLQGRPGWTHLVMCRIQRGKRDLWLHPWRSNSRLMSISRCEAILPMGEQAKPLSHGTRVAFICIQPAVLGAPVT
jgi:molybdopterin molybdotransferase